MSSNFFLIAKISSNLTSFHPFEQIYNDSVQNVDESVALFISLVPHGQLMKIYRKNNDVHYYY